MATENPSRKLLAVLRGQKFDVPPVWLMRQAGRYLPEYRELRAEKGGFLALAYDPPLWFRRCDPVFRYPRCPTRYGAGSMVRDW